MSRLAESLARCGAEVEILSLNPRKHRGVPQGPLPIRAVDIDTSRVLVPALRAPFVVARFISPAFYETLGATLRRFRPDVVQIESPFLLSYARGIDARVVLRSHNVEFRIWEGLARTEPNPFRRFALSRVASSLRDYELRTINTLDAIIPISESDAADFRTLGCTVPMHVVPCGVRRPTTSYDALGGSTVGFIGSLDFRPNIQAVDWILTKLWPLVVERVCDAKLLIAGSSPPERLRPFVLADIEDANAFLQDVSVFIAPLFAGGGMRIKVLEAMAMGKPIVATALGAGGIDVTHDHDILLAEDASSFADAVVRLLREPDTASRIGAAARETVINRYESDALARGLLRFYESL